MKRTSLLAAATAAATLAAPASASASEGGRRFTVQLTGAAERPGPGDPDGAGTATLRINPGQGQICYTITVRNIDPATAAHIHRAPPTQAGPVVVPLEAPAAGSSEACVTVERSLAMEIIRNPGNFYVNVHNAAFKPGAVRGQLSR